METSRSEVVLELELPTGIADRGTSRVVSYCGAGHAVLRQVTSNDVKASNRADCRALSRLGQTRTDEGNISKSTKNDMIELMVKDLGADAQKQQVAIENNDLHRTTALYDSQSMDYLRSQWQALFFTICVVALLVFIACKNTTRRK
ncbi:hypothetical protein [Klebsiella pneumoniae]|uniref:hypothetical protein n=1 Tax=Klebsiella pneumoniae TaxID=573 RepID=UPI00200CD5ED|nr:hypothetical protein [Klebsiella pneumoniae]UPY99797.1 hypothetical protein MOV22_26680 [Klebsiella pneumoniae]